MGWPTRVLALLLTASGCEPPPPCYPAARPPLSQPAPAPPAVVALGQGQRLSLATWPTLDCRGHLQRAHAVEVELRDSREGLAHAQVQSFESSYEGYVAEVEVSAARPGWHHLAVRFEPSLSLAQHPLLAVYPRPPPSQALAPDLECHTLAQTTSGTWVCQASSRSQTIAIHPSRAKEEIGTWASVWGNTVWTLEGPTLQRWEDTGRGWVLTAPALESNQWVEAQGLFSTERRALVLTEGKQLEVSWSAGALHLDFAAPSPSPPGAYLALATDTGHLRAWHSAPDETLLCTKAWGQAPTQCHPVPGVPVGVGDGLLWLQQEGGRLVALEPHTARAVASLTLPRGYTATRSHPLGGSSWPQLVGPSILVPLLDGEDIVLEQFQPEEGFTGATDTFSWTQRMQIHPRPVH